jgi:hypothetical protein
MGDMRISFFAAGALVASEIVEAGNGAELLARERRTL